jgi:hypothetical protein
MARFSGGSGSGGDSVPGPQGLPGPTGPAGSDGAGFNYQGDFDYGVTYAANDAVTFDGGLWKLNNFIGAAGYTPTPGQWSLILPPGTDGATGPAGADGEGFNYRGAVTPSTQYFINDVVQYEGSLFIATANTYAWPALPDNGAWWDLFIPKGVDGATGPTGSQGLYYLGDYVSGNGYTSNLAVVKGSDNNLYIATSSGGLGDPVANPAEWSTFLPKGADGTVRSSYQGDWQAETTYSVDDIVIHNGSSWLSYNNENVGNEPYNDNANGMMSHWIAIALAGNHGSVWYNGGESWDPTVEAPSGSIAGDYFYKTDNGNIYYNDSATGWGIVGNIQGSSANTGDITFDGIQIIGAGTASGDGYQNGTIRLVPDADLNSDQYLIIDPTSPNHIHIRAGGTQDDSSAHLIVGGERNNVEVSDPYRTVKIHTAPELITNTYVNTNPDSEQRFFASPLSDIQNGHTVNVDGINYVVDSTMPVDGQTFAWTASGAVFTAGQSYTFSYEQPYVNEWTFASDGILSGPAQGDVYLRGISGADGVDLRLHSSDSDIVLNSATGGEYLNDPTDPANQIATIGDLGTGANGEVVRYSPNFEATGLAFTGAGVTYPTYNSYYIKNGRMVSFVIEVDLTTVTSFGTGQYKVQLPFTPQFGFNHFSGWAWADPNVSPDVGTGHTIINADTAGVTDVLDLHYLKSAGGANAPIREGLFVQGTPVTLSTISKIYINGTYITAA